MRLELILQHKNEVYIESNERVLQSCGEGGEQGCCGVGVRIDYTAL
jgi:hypothetical protein